jgi:hypothetical protein
MDPLELLTHSFIVKIWLSDAESTNGEKLWRGTITHVPSGKRRSVATFDDIDSFIEQYVTYGDAPVPHRRAQNWWARLRRLLSGIFRPG